MFALLGNLEGTTITKVGCRSL